MVRGHLAEVELNNVASLVMVAVIIFSVDFMGDTHGLGSNDNRVEKVE